MTDSRVPVYYRGWFFASYLLALGLLLFVAVVPEVRLPDGAAAAAALPLGQETEEVDDSGPVVIEVDGASIELPSVPADAAPQSLVDVVPAEPSAAVGPDVFAFLVQERTRRVALATYRMPLTAYEHRKVLQHTLYVMAQNRNIGKVEAYRVASSLHKAAKFYGLDPVLVFAVAQTESCYNRHAVSHANARGVMQVHHPCWGKKYSIYQSEWSNTYLNAQVGCSILSRNIRASGDLTKALYAYLGGRDPSYVATVRDHMLRQYRFFARLATGSARRAG